MWLENEIIRNEDIAAMQYFKARTKKENHRTKVASPAYFEIILRSGVTLRVLGDYALYSKAVQQLGISESKAGA